MPDPETTQTVPEPLDTWAKLELFGRQTAAGHIREVKIAGDDFLRLHIPAESCADGQPRTIDYNPAAVYSIEHVDEETARLAARLEQPPEPVSTWSARRMIQQSGSQRAIGGVPDDDGEEEEDDGLDLSVPDDEEDDLEHGAPL